MQIGTGKYVAKRMLAGLIDYGAYFAVFTGYCRMYGEPNAAGDYEVHGCSHVLFLFAVWIVLLPLPEVIWGRGIGKWLADLHVAKAASFESPPDALAVAKRHVMSFIEVGMCFGVLAVIVILSTERRQRLGDLWAQTLVIDRDQPLPNES